MLNIFQIKGRSFPEHAHKLCQCNSYIESSYNKSRTHNNSHAQKITTTNFEQLLGRRWWFPKHAQCTRCVGATVVHSLTTTKAVHTRQLYIINNLQLHNAHVHTT